MSPPPALPNRPLAVALALAVVLHLGLLPLAPDPFAWSEAGAPPGSPPLSVSLLPSGGVLSHATLAPEGGEGSDQRGEPATAEPATTEPATAERAPEVDRPAVGMLEHGPDPAPPMSDRVRVPPRSSPPVSVEASLEGTPRSAARARRALPSRPLPEGLSALASVPLSGASPGTPAVAGGASRPAAGGAAEDEGLMAGREPSALVRVPPVYPPGARARGVQGRVVVEFTIGADGRVADPQVVEATPRGVFEGAALDAVRQWRFAPRVRGLEAEPARARQTIQFVLRS